MNMLEVKIETLDVNVKTLDSEVKVLPVEVKTFLIYTCGSCLWCLICQVTLNNLSPRLYKIDGCLFLKPSVFILSKI